MPTVNEKTSCTLTCVFTDESKNPVTPTTASCRIDDDLSGTCIRADTPFTPPDIEITADENRIINTDKATEARRVTVRWTYGTNKAGCEEYRYEVKNLSKVS